MTTFYALAARFCGLAAAVCLGLAFLASPAVSRADDDGPTGPGVPQDPGNKQCGINCSSYYDQSDPNYDKCVKACQGNSLSFFCSGCTQDEGCYAAFLCNCATPGFTCKYKLSSSTECVCRL